MITVMQRVVVKGGQTVVNQSSSMNERKGLGPLMIAEWSHDARQHSSLKHNHPSSDGKE
jgi:hypothetical protein